MVTNSIQLEIEFNERMKLVINGVAEKLTNKLLEIIEEEVYNAYSPSFYTRTHQFADSWTHTDAKQVHDNIIQSEIFQDYAVMVFNEDLWQHGSKFYQEALVEHGLAEIINDGKIGRIFPNIGARPFWDKFKNYVEQHIDEIFLEECNKYGIPIQRSSGIFYQFS